VYFGVFLLRPRCDCRIFLVEPSPDFCGALFVGDTRRFLRRKSPTFEIFSNSANGDMHAETVLNQELHGAACPKRKGQFELVRRLVAYFLPDHGFLLGAKQPLVADAATAPFCL